MSFETAIFLTLNLLFFGGLGIALCLLHRKFQRSRNSTTVPDCPICGYRWAVPTAAQCPSCGHPRAFTAGAIPQPRCPKCKYLLTDNLSGVCPECGTPIQTNQVKM